MELSLTSEKIAALAPDQSALTASNKLVKPAKWPLLAGNADESLIWGECQGSGATPYRVMADLGDLGNKCTCPSRKFPCKHVLALLRLACDERERFETAETPDWVNDWLSRRRPKKTGSANSRPNKKTAASTASFARAEIESHVVKPVDPKAAARAEAQRLRLREEREASIMNGLDELDRWIIDQLNEGLANFPVNATQACRAMAARLVDAKAPGLAAMVDDLGSRLFAIPQVMRSAYATERLSAIALLSSAYRNQPRLPDMLREDVRRQIGWVVRREDLLEDKGALRVTAEWQVVAARSEVQPDRLRRLETWLLRLGSRDSGEPDFALLLDFTPVASGPSAPPYFAGERFSADIVYYRSAAPLRALMVTRSAPDDSTGWSPDMIVENVLQDWETRLARHPWLEEWPLLIGKCRLVADEDQRLWLYDEMGAALPVAEKNPEAAAPLIGLPDIAAAGLWNGRGFCLLAADTPIGAWYDR